MFLKLIWWHVTNQKTLQKDILLFTFQEKLISVPSTLGAISYECLSMSILCKYCVSHIYANNEFAAMVTVTAHETKSMGVNFTSIMHGNLGLTPSGVYQSWLNIHNLHVVNLQATIAWLTFFPCVSILAQSFPTRQKSMTPYTPLYVRENFRLSYPITLFYHLVGWLRYN